MPEVTGHTLGAYERRGDLELGRGDVISTGDLAAYPGDYPVYSSSAVGDGVFGRYGRHMFDEELITWSIDGGGRPFHRRKHRFSVTNVCGFLRIKRPDRWDYGYLHAILEKLQSGIQFDYQMKAHPSVVRDLYRFDCVPFNEQRAIAAVRDTLDTTIRQTEAIIEKLKQVKQGLLHDLLTRGIDANGELRPPQSQAPHLYKDSPLGRIPREWESLAFGVFAVKIQDGTHFSPVLNGGEYMYVTSKNVRFGYLDLSDVDRIEKSQHDAIYRRCDVRTGDLLLTKDGATTGNAALNTCSDQISILSSVAFLRFDSEADVTAFFLHFLLSPSGQQRLKDLMSGNAITRLTLQKIRGFPVPRPSVSEQQQIASVLNHCDERGSAVKAELAKLRELKSGLMDDLLTGRVRVTPLLA